MSRKDLLLAAVKRGKYARLYEHLSSFNGAEWSTTFHEIENILGFKLPNSAHLYRPWWANDSGSGHSQSMAWVLAGWRTTKVDMEGQTLKFFKSSEEDEDSVMKRPEHAKRAFAPTMEDFRSELEDRLFQARTLNVSSITITSGDLHRSVGGYPTPFNRMTMCCKAMYEAMKSGDKIRNKPKSDFGASLAIEYSMPR